MQQQPLLSPDPPSPSLCPPCAARVLDTWGRACFGHLGTGLFCPIFGHSGTGLSATSSPFTPHLPLPHLPPHTPFVSRHYPLTFRHYAARPIIFFGFFCSFSTVLNVTMLFSRAACCALSHTHIAPRKIVLTAPFFSLVLDVAICSPSLLLYAFIYHSAPLPGVISHRNLHLAHHFFFGYFRCLYVCTRPPPIVSSSLYAARRHFSSNHTDFGKSPSLDFYSLPWIGALLSFYFVSRQFCFQSFCMFQCVCRRKTHSAAFAPPVLGTLRFRPTAILRLLRFDLPACNTEYRRMRHIQCRNTFLIVLWHI